MTTRFANCDLEVLRAAILRAGMDITMENSERGYIYFRDRETGRTGAFRNGQFELQEGLDVNAIKKAYSSEAVERASKKYGFSIKKKVGNKYTLSRRTY